MAGPQLGQEKQKRRREKQSLSHAVNADFVEEKKMSDTSNEENSMKEKNVGSSKNSSESLRGGNFGTVVQTTEPRLKKGNELVAPVNEILSQSGAFTTQMVKNHTEVSVVLKKYKRKKVYNSCENDLSQSMLEGESTCNLPVNIASEVDSRRENLDAFTTQMVKNHTEASVVLKKYKRKKVYNACENDLSQSMLEGGSTCKTSIDGKKDGASIIGKKYGVIESADCGSEKMCDLAAQIVPGNTCANNPSIDNIVVRDSARKKNSKTSIDENLNVEKDSISLTKSVKADSVKSDIGPGIDSNSHEVTYNSPIGTKRTRRKGKVKSDFSSSTQEDVTTSLQFFPNCTTSIVSSSVEMADVELENKNNNKASCKDNLTLLAKEGALSKSADANILKENDVLLDINSKLNDVKSTKSRKHKGQRKRRNDKSSDTKTAACSSHQVIQCGTSAKSSSIVGFAEKDLEEKNSVETSDSNSLMPLVEKENNATTNDASAGSNKSGISSEINSNLETVNNTSAKKHKKGKRGKKNVFDFSQSGTELDPDHPSAINSSSPETAEVQLEERDICDAPTRKNLMPLIGIHDSADVNSPNKNNISLEIDSNSFEVENPSLVQTKKTKEEVNNSPNCLECKVEQLQKNVTGTSLQVIECSKENSSDKASVPEKVKKLRQRKKKVKHMIPEERASDIALAQKNEDYLVPLSLNKDEKLESLAVLPERTLKNRARRKLLVLDLNGLLCDVVFGFYGTHNAYRQVGKSSVFKRPFCDDFLKFCIERFDIGVWSSRNKNNVDGVVAFVMGDIKHKLLFCWDVSKCTFTGFNTIENRHKPLLLKELKKLWNKEEADLPWEKGDYLPTNTLLVDDSPYKALCNPPHTAIFPCPYHFSDENDVSLGPGGDLRVYLEGLAVADDVQRYVREHPFGQRAITATNASWEYYHQIINKIKISSALS